MGKKLVAFLSLVTFVMLADVLSSGGLSNATSSIFGQGSSPAPRQFASAPPIDRAHVASPITAPRSDSGADTARADAGAKATPHAVAVPQAPPRTTRSGTCPWGGALFAATPPRASNHWEPKTTKEDPGTNCGLQPCWPLMVRNGQLFLRRLPGAVAEPEVYKVGPVRPNPRDPSKAQFAFLPEIRHVVIDVGTSAEPDSVKDWWTNESVGFLWFEPIASMQSHQMHLDKTRNVVGFHQSRVFGFPAAVGITNEHRKIYLSKVSGCTSLLEMNTAALSNPGFIPPGTFEGRDKDFSDFRPQKVGFINCITKNSGRTEEMISVLRGEPLAAMIPPELSIPLLATDAQGFDLVATASFGPLLHRADFLMLECQDWPEGSDMFVTKGAYSCSDIRACIEALLPHRMVHPITMQPSDFCPTNNPSRERNCIFRRMDRPPLEPSKIYQFTRTPYKLDHPPQKNLKCPSLESLATNTVPVPL